ncbi:MAG: hypothetical protein AMJ88_13275 [Anaerolineae bacterium SM23_ 63]|nr:MAG: hypothetical protein AMJ88_13275 [Anaerolineae bacterium SM23_ 63]HEY47993.1 hypothetical protein [Anaerolineae bacterium]
MSNTTTHQTVFLTLVRTTGERARARILIDSIRSFGEAMSQYPIWLFEADTVKAPCKSLEGMGIQVLPLNAPNSVRRYYFGDKVYACARAEEMTPQEAQTLIWIDPGCLVIKPPLLFDLGQSFDTAVRPVHIRNVGLTYTEPLDGFWKGIYEAVGVKDIQSSVETFVDLHHIRSYFNSHAFAVNPSSGLLRQWLDTFEVLVKDEEFQLSYCQDELHRIFLHQAILSALLVTTLDQQRIRLLPPDYNYPYNLHQSVPLDRRAQALNDLVCIAYEDRTLDPNMVDDIEIHEPLRTWLSTNFAPSGLKNE